MTLLDYVKLDRRRKQARVAPERKFGRCHACGQRRPVHDLNAEQVCTTCLSIRRVHAEALARIKEQNQMASRASEAWPPGVKAIGGDGK
jgi:RNA polymerase-binding transcription factor DksA